MRTEQFTDSLLGRFTRVYVDRPFDGIRYRVPYFEGTIKKGINRGLRISVEGLTAQDAELLLPRAREIAANVLPVPDMIAELFATFPRAFEGHSLRSLAYTLSPGGICVGRAGDYAVDFDADTEDQNLLDYWPVVRVGADNSIVSAHCDGGRGDYPGGSEYVLTEEAWEALHSWPDEPIPNR